MTELETLRSLTVVLTARCNLSCSYCYQNARPWRDMDWATLRPALDLLLASERSEVDLVFYGGEPLLRFELIRRAVGYLESCRRPGPIVRPQVLTNGTLLGRKEAEFLAAHGIGTQLSFDGVAAAQSLRGERTFARLDRLLERLPRDHPEWFRKHLSVSMTVLPPTVRHLADGVRYLLAKGVREIGFSPVITDSSGWRLEQIDELDDQFRRILELAVRHYRATGEVPVETFRRNPASERPRPDMLSMCNVGRGDSLTVDVDGRVYGCALFARSFQTWPGGFLAGRLEPLQMTDFRSPDFRNRLAAHPAAVRAAEIFDHKEQKYSSYLRCRDCDELATCKICPISIGHIPGNHDPNRVPDFLCAFIRVSNRYRRRFRARIDPNALLKGSPDVPDSLLRLKAALEARADSVRPGLSSAGSAPE